MPDSANPIFRRPPRCVFALLLLALVLRLLVWSGGLPNSTRLMEPDSFDYTRLALNLTTEHIYGAPGNPELFRTPGYPVFLALVSYISTAPALICLLQVLLDTLSCYLTWLLALRLFGSRTASIALTLQALSVVSIVFCNRLLSESVFTFFLLWFIILLLHLTSQLETTARIIDSVAAGIMLGILIYLRAVALPYAVLVLVFLACLRRWRTALIILLTTGATILPWHVRNQVRTGYAGFSTVGAVNLYRYNACMLLARQHGRSFAEQQAIIDKELANLPDQAAVGRHCAARGREIISAAPLKYATLHLRTSTTSLLPAAGDLLRTFGVGIGGSGTLAIVNSAGLTAGVRHYFKGRPWLLLLVSPLVLLLLCTYISALTGAIERLLRKRCNCSDYLMIFSILYFLAVVGPAAHPRFRVPITPLISVYSALGMLYLIQFSKRFLSRQGKT